MAHARVIVEGMADAIWDVATGGSASGDDDVPEAAEQAARELANLYTTLNERSLDALFSAARTICADQAPDLEVCADCSQSTAEGSPDPHVCGESTDVSDEEILHYYAWSFGFDLAMLAMNRETEWFRDDDANAALKLVEPTFEVSIDGDSLTWTGGAREALYVNPGSVMTGPGWNTARDKLRSAAAKKNPGVFQLGQRVVVTAPEDDSEVIGEGTVMRLPGRGWIGIELDGEGRVDEWPLERVWPIDPELIQNPALFKHAPGAHVADRTGTRSTARYAIPAREQRSTPRVADHRAAVDTRWGRAIGKMATDLDGRAIDIPRARPKRGPGRPRKVARNPSSVDLRFPFVCKHCKRGLAELMTEKGSYIDATELSKKCPTSKSGLHEPYPQKV